MKTHDFLCCIAFTFMPLVTVEVKLSETDFSGSKLYFPTATVTSTRYPHLRGIYSFCLDYFSSVGIWLFDLYIFEELNIYKRSANIF